MILLSLLIKKKLTEEILSTTTTSINIMITFIKNSEKEPYVNFRKIYNEALNSNQSNIEAMVIASYDSTKDEVDARYVNCKTLDNNNFIFYTNYNSPKSQQFYSHKQVSAIFYWASINTQIRIKASIEKISYKHSQSHFSSRSREKNAIAVSSMQSKKIASYDEVLKNYNLVLNSSKDLECPSYWGGFSLSPYYFEFWQGHQSRINKRESYELVNEIWSKNFLQP